MATFVWVVESGAYEQHGIDGIYSSLEKAVEGIKASHSSIVNWQLKINEWCSILKEVKNVPSMWDDGWEITKYELDEKGEIETTS